MCKSGKVDLNIYDTELCEHFKIAYFLDKL